MKRVSLLLLIAAAGSVAAGDLTSSTDSRHRQQNFILHLNATMPAATRLFGPVHEAEWSPDWKPQFVYPATASQVEGAIFVTKAHGGRECIWVMTAYDETQGRIEYVVVTPGLTASQISVQVASEGPDKCRATVTYRHTALSRDGTTEVEKLNAAWAEQQRVHWEAAINDALARRQKK
jgi:hypothetical protein